jgi:hypothetical protein
VRCDDQVDILDGQLSRAQLLLRGEVLGRPRHGTIPSIMTVSGDPPPRRCATAPAPHTVEPAAATRPTYPTRPPDQGARNVRFLRETIKIIRANFRAYLVANAVIYGLVLLGFGLALVFPELTEAQLAAMEAGGSLALIRSLLDNAWLFALTILLVNVLRVGVVTILLPSMIVPFSGIALFGYSAFTIGTTLAPTDEEGWIALIPHSLTVVIEFQAYVLFVLGAYLLGRSWLWPRTVGAENRRQGYGRGLRQVGWLSLSALVLLVIGAIYEAVTLVYLVPVMIDAMVG